MKFKCDKKQKQKTLGEKQIFQFLFNKTSDENEALTSSKKWNRGLQERFLCGCFMAGQFLHHHHLNKNANKCIFNEASK